MMTVEEYRARIAALEAELAEMIDLAQLNDEILTSKENKIAALKAELLATCQREAATHARHDAKIAALEVQVAAADLLAAASDRVSEWDTWAYTYGGVCPDHLIGCLDDMRNALAAYRAAKGE